MMHIVGVVQDGHIYFDRDYIYNFYSEANIRYAN